VAEPRLAREVASCLRLATPPRQLVKRGEHVVVLIGEKIRIAARLEPRRTPTLATGTAWVPDASPGRAPLDIFGRGIMLRMASEVGAAQDSVILASFENRHAAEHMVASLGRGFREKHRKGHATALVISDNKDGSLRLTQSRALTASGFVYTVIRISLSWMIGFMGLFSTLRGGIGATHEVRARKSHVGSDEHAAHAMLARVGPDAALVLVSCDDQETRQAVVARAADSASESWDGSRAEFLAALDPGSQHDWVRAAVGELQPRPAH
jgi:hypothetical protein